VSALHAGLAWLPPPPKDFAAQCRDLGEDTAEHLGRRVQALARYGLDENQLDRLARAIARARECGRSLAPLAPFRLGLVSNATTHLLVPALVATAARHGIALVCIEAEYGQVMQEALSPASTLARADLDAVLIALDYRGLPLLPTPGSAEQAEETVAGCLDMLRTIRTGFTRQRRRALHRADSGPTAGGAVRQPRPRLARHAPARSGTSPTRSTED
jgi:hypothetical protein